MTRSIDRKHWGNAPTEFCRQYEVRFRMYNKMELYNEINGVKPDGLYRNSHKHGAIWDFW